MTPWLLDVFAPVLLFGGPLGLVATLIWGRAELAKARERAAWKGR